MTNLINDRFFPLDPTGQFLSFKIPKSDLPDAEHDFVRNYSISCRPGLGTFRVSVKREVDPRTKDGVVSNHFHDRVSVGDRVLVGVPCGTFNLDTGSAAPVVLLAAGVGQTPLIAMLEHLRHAQPGRRVAFVHSARDAAHHAFAAHVDAMAAASACVESHLFLTAPGAKRPEGLNGLTRDGRRGFQANRAREAS